MFFIPVKGEWDFLFFCFNFYYLPNGYFFLHLYHVHQIFLRIKCEVIIMQQVNFIRDPSVFTYIILGQTIVLQEINIFHTIFQSVRLWKSMSFSSRWLLFELFCLDLVMNKIILWQKINIMWIAFTFKSGWSCCLNKINPVLFIVFFVKKFHNVRERNFYWNGFLLFLFALSISLPFNGDLGKEHRMFGIIYKL